MLHCSECHSSISIGQKFCDQCGKSADSAVLVCDGCGTSCANKAKFCTKCGAAFQTPHMSPSFVPLEDDRIEPSINLRGEPSPAIYADAKDELFSKVKTAEDEHERLVFGRWSERDLRKWLKITGVAAVVGIVGVFLIVQISGGEKPASAAEVAASVDLSVANGAVVQAGALAPGADQMPSIGNRKIIYQLGNIPAAKTEEPASADGGDAAASPETNTAQDANANATHSAGSDVATSDAKSDKSKTANKAGTQDAEVDAARKAMNDFLKQQQ
ncbi:zinc ribbon domain-containing protein [Leeia sp. TBRC 13508]|uniref:Zinc ribbon domain-containing protein n=1 Tax=Leeia speluncae TaxID=2884804 RepID=A0ABS8D5L1_9NEIS|nr:zinc ribbon domain-containing protein [Leeia speluncae]MCB6183505.1 zinc ribbon domain-containing protein [Leeia speluncae]